jgi:hypothetical protein
MAIRAQQIIETLPQFRIDCHTLLASHDMNSISIADPNGEHDIPLSGVASQHFTDLR